VAVASTSAHNALLRFVVSLIKRYRREQKTGYAWYGDYQLPANSTDAGKTVTLRFDSPLDDDPNKLAYRLRPVTPFTEDWAQVHRHRAFAESRNRDLERSMEGGRAHSYGAPAVMTDMILKIMLDNAHNVALHLRRHPQKRTAPLSAKRSLPTQGPKPFEIVRWQWTISRVRQTATTNPLAR
jgi:hypothetical protein